MTSSPRVQLELAGGLGDILLGYFDEHGPTSRLASLKDRYPDSFVRLALCTTNPHAGAFFAAHPHIDETVWLPLDAIWRQRLVSSRGKRLPLAQAVDISLLAAKRPDIYLDVKERKAADELLSRGGFVCIHPFAGSSERDWRGHVDLTTVMNALCDAGHTVVMVGGTSTRHESGVVTRLDEQFHLHRPGFVNLVNTHSVRFTRCWPGPFLASLGH